MVYLDRAAQAKISTSSVGRQPFTPDTLLRRERPEKIFHFSYFSLLTTESVFHIRLLPHLQGL